MIVLASVLPSLATLKEKTKTSFPRHYLYLRWHRKCLYTPKALIYPTASERTLFYLVTYADENF